MSKEHMDEGLSARSGVAHLSRAARVPLAQVLGGSEPTHMTPSLASEISVLDEPLACWMVSDSSTMEINLLDRYLDILATAELPGTGEQIQVAIENQYGTADPDHFGRLVGWYMPETGAQMGVLIAEGFEPQLIKAVSDGQVIRPEHGLWLVEACGFVLGDAKFVTYTTRASSLPRAELIRRERAFAKGRSAGSASESNAEALKRAAALFEYIIATSTGWLGQALRRSPVTVGYYRWISDNQNTCHQELFVGTDRISVGSSYFRGKHDEVTLEALVAANQNTEVEPAPARRHSRGSWWDLRLDIGRDTPLEKLSNTLGDDIERSIDAVRIALDAHQQALRQAAQPTVS